MGFVWIHYCRKYVVQTLSLRETGLIKFIYKTFSLELDDQTVDSESINYLGQ